MKALFYTALVVATVYSIVSVFGWACVAHLDYKCWKRGIATTVRLRPLRMIPDVIVLIYWTWMVVRLFVSE